MRKDHGHELDYLQVFELIAIGDKQVIVNTQEQPPMTKTFHLELKERDPIETTLWIMDSKVYSTILFPSDY
jgi:hypothetical protein